MTGSAFDLAGKTAVITGGAYPVDGGTLTLR